MRFPISSKSIFGAALLLVPSLSHAALLLDSIGGTDGTLLGELSNDGKAVVFTTGPSAYALDNAVVRVNLPNLTSASTFHAGIFSASGSKPGTELVSFTFPTVTATGAQSLTLTPATPITLAANTTYFFALWGTDPANGAGWYYETTTGPASTVGYTFPDVVSGGSTQYGWYYDSNNGGNTLTNPNSWFQSTGVYNDLVLNGTLVPEPSSALLVASLGILGLARRRR